MAPNGIAWELGQPIKAPPGPTGWPNRSRIEAANGHAVPQWKGDGDTIMLSIRPFDTCNKNRKLTQLASIEAEESSESMAPHITGKT